MFDRNQFKRSVKDWIRDNPTGTLNDFVDFCEEQIPPAQFAANQWLLDQTVSWYQHILSSRKTDSSLLQESHDEAEVS